MNELELYRNMGMLDKDIDACTGYFTRAKGIKDYIFEKYKIELTVEEIIVNILSESEKFVRPFPTV